MCIHSGDQARVSYTIMIETGIWRAGILVWKVYYFHATAFRQMLPNTQHTQRAEKGGRCIADDIFSAFPWNTVFNQATLNFLSSPCKVSIVSTDSENGLVA